jgi:hypothetical protein
MHTSTESSILCVTAAITAFIAVSPCPVTGMAVQALCVSATVAIVACALGAYTLAISVGLAYVAFSLRSRVCAREASSLPEAFTRGAPETASRQADAAADASGEDAVPYALYARDRVAETMTREMLRDLITPELLAAAQSNEV